MQYCRYPPGALAADYARCAAGLLCTIGPLGLLQPASGIAWVLGGAAALFFVYFAHTIVRNLTCVELDQDGIRIKGPQDAWIPWVELRLVRLNYYTTRSDRSGGWMQLELRGGRRTIRVDSRIGGFGDIARMATREMLLRGQRIDAGSLANLRALGLVADGVPMVCSGQAHD